jgi:hypothetical protein
MTTHKAHVTLFHNQCLALQAVAIFTAIYQERLARDESWDYRSAIADWIYGHAARHMIPSLFNGVPESPYPCFSSGHPMRLPRVVYNDDDSDTESGGP